METSEAEKSEFDQFFDALKKAHRDKCPCCAQLAEREAEIAELRKAAYPCETNGHDMQPVYALATGEVSHYECSRTNCHVQSEHQKEQG